MTDRQFQNVVFSLWAFKFTYTIDQLFEDGAKRKDVLNYLKLNTNDAGFVWRSSYADHLDRLGDQPYARFYLKEFLTGIWNIVHFMLFAFACATRKRSCFSTRAVSSQDFGTFGNAVPRTLKLRADKGLLVLPFLRNLDEATWREKFCKAVGNGEYEISSKTKHFLEQHVHEIFPIVFQVKARGGRIFQNTEVVNFAGDIFKSVTFFELMWIFFDGSISGAQHGGGYNVVKSRLFAAEMACYESFHLRRLGIGVAQNEPREKVELVGRPGVILAGSMPFDVVEAFRENRVGNVSEIVAESRKQLRRKLKKSQVPLYIREHPKSGISSYQNSESRVPNGGKPVIWARKDDLIVLEAPGTTTEIDCLKFGLSFVCVFDLAQYQLTPTGFEHYGKLKAQGKLISIQEIGSFVREKFND